MADSQVDHTAEADCLAVLGHIAAADHTAEAGYIAEAGCIAELGCIAEVDCTAEVGHMVAVVAVIVVDCKSIAVQYCRTVEEVDTEDVEPVLLVGGKVGSARLDQVLVDTAWVLE